MTAMDKSPPQAALEDLRQQVLQCDEQIITCLAARLRITKNIGELKAHLNEPVRNRAVENQLKHHYLKLAQQHGVSTLLAMRLHHLLLQESRRMQRLQQGGGDAASSASAVAS